MPSNYTPNYQLSQWEPGDRVLRADFNADNAKLDAAIKAVDTRADQLAAGKADASAVAALAQTVAEQESALEGHAASIAKLGNCQVYLTTYRGTGSGACSHTFPHYPVFALIRAVDRSGRAELVRGVTNNGNTALASGDTGLNVSWSGNKLTWSASNMVAQLNESGVSYSILALLDASR